MAVGDEGRHRRVLVVLGKVAGQTRCDVGWWQCGENHDDT